MHCEKGNNKKRRTRPSNKENQPTSSVPGLPRVWVGGAERCQVFLTRRTVKNMLRTLWDDRRTPFEKTDSYIRGNTVGFIFCWGFFFLYTFSFKTGTWWCTLCVWSRAKRNSYRKIFLKKKRNRYSFITHKLLI
jgi:hypothetical protein